MKKLSITEEELKQSLSQLNGYTLEQLSDELFGATTFSREDISGKYQKTPLHDILDSIWDAVIQEQNNRKAIKYYEDNQYIRTL